MSVAQTDAYTGKRVSVLTKAQSRYEGTVIKIDKVERALHLSNVRQFGTEGRRNGDNEIAAKDLIAEVLVFRIQLVENFHIINEEPD